MSSDVTKRALSAGLGVGALALLAPRASADTPFSSFAFPATGAPTARTLPDRLGELKTVKDFGARGNGVADDTAAIQAAANAAGRVFFPAGTYIVSQTITTPSPERGSFFYGYNDVGIVGSFNGYIFNIQGNQSESNTTHFEGLFIRNGDAPQGGGILVTNGLNHSIRNCSFAANRALTLRACISSEVTNCHFNPGAGSPLPSGGSVPGSVGIMAVGNNPTAPVGGSVNISITGCDLAGFEHGIRVQGACAMRSLRIEMCSVGIVVGMTEAGGTYSSAAFMEHLEMEANGIHIWLSNGAYGVSINHAGLLGDLGFSGDVTDGKESRVGIMTENFAWLTTNMVTVDGHYRDASIKFNGQLIKSVFISTVVNTPADPLPGSVAWRGMNLIGAGNATFIQCNQPPA